MNFIENPGLLKKRLLVGGIIILCIILFMIVINIISNHQTKNVDKKKTELVINELYDNVTYYNDSLFLIKESESTKLLDKNLKLIEDIKTTSNNVFPLYDDYYLVLSNDNYILKRKGSIIKKDIKFINTGLFKNEIYQDKPSKYISYMYLYNVVNNKKSVILNDYVFTGNLLYNSTTGVIIDESVTKVEVINNDYLYVLSNDLEYIIDTKNNKKILEEYKFKFDHFISNKYLVIKENNLYGLATYDGKVLLYPEFNDIITTPLNNLIIAKKGEYYGIINKVANIILPFIYDSIECYKDFYFTIKNNELNIYNKNNKLVTDTTYKVKDINNLNIKEYDDFYSLKIVEPNLVEKTLIIDKSGNINLVDDITYIKYSEIFTGKEKFIVNIDNSFYIYNSSSEKITLSDKIITKLNKAIMLNDYTIYVDFPVVELNKTRYIYLKYKTGTVIDYNTLDVVTNDFDVFKVENLIFSKINNVTSIYNETYQLLKEEKDLSITHLYDDYYMYNNETSSKLMEIKY